MHAILFQMALIPLTMCRTSIAKLSGSGLNRFIPLNRAVRIHIWLGYVMISIVCLATLVFFLFFGLLCIGGPSYPGDEKICAKFTSEIMITGYVIFAFLLIIAGTSHFRNSIPYEVFYVVHHLVFLLYIVTIVHTIDTQQRQQQSQRSQTFKWFSATLLYYICDRCAMYLNYKYTTTVVSAQTIDNGPSEKSVNPAAVGDLEVGKVSHEVSGREHNGSLDLTNLNVNVDAQSSDGPGHICSAGQKMLILKVRRPVLFDFSPGQYAYLRVKQISAYQWHPFSIASGPSSTSTDKSMVSSEQDKKAKFDTAIMEFYIEVQGKDSWTDKLWHLLHEESEGTSNVEIDVMGPYGTSLAPTSGGLKDYSHVVAIGTGSGIVPVLSLLKEHLFQLRRLDPKTYASQIKIQEQQLTLMEDAADQRKGSIARKIYETICCSSRQTATPLTPESSCDLRETRAFSSERTKRLPSSEMDRPQLHRRQSRRDSQKRMIVESMRRFSSTDMSSSSLQWQSRSSMFLSTSPKRRLISRSEMKRASFQATRSIYGVVLLESLPVFGIFLLGIGISWNLLDSSQRYDGMMEFFQIFTVFFQSAFAVVALMIWEASQFPALIDAALTLITPFADWYWFLQIQKAGALDTSQLVLYSLLIGYMSLRFWVMTVRPRHQSWRQSMANPNSTGTVDRLNVVWATRSACLASEILPEINNLWSELVQTWGEEKALDVCRIGVYITDTDNNSIHKLNQDFCGSALFESGCVRFQRPNIPQIIQDHSLDLTCSRRNSHSLLAFCGSPLLAKDVHQYKIANDMIVAMTGNKKHQMEFVSECYGGYKKHVAQNTKLLQKQKLKTASNDDLSNSNESITHASEDILLESGFDMDHDQGVTHSSLVCSSVLLNGNRNDLSKEDEQVELEKEAQREDPSNASTTRSPTTEPLDAKEGTNDVTARKAEVAKKEDMEFTNEVTPKRPVDDGLKVEASNDPQFTSSEPPTKKIRTTIVDAVEEATGISSKLGFPGRLRLELEDIFAPYSFLNSRGNAGRCHPEFRDFSSRDETTASCQTPRKSRCTTSV